MSIIEEIKRDVRHDEDCASERHEFLRDFNDPRACMQCGYTERSTIHDTSNTACDCSRRRKIAFLERLEEPTEAMTLHVLKECDRNGYAWTRGMIDELDVNTAFKAMLKAAEEDLP